MSSQLFSFLFFFFFLRWQLLSVEPCGVFGEMGASLIHKWKVFDVSLRRGWGWGVNHRFLSCIVYQHKPRVAVAV